jgi:hypothetical protein
MKTNTYINATKLCKEYGKRFDNWTQNKSNKELIDEIEKENSVPGIPGTEFKSSFILVKSYGNNQKICGTYVHPLLIPHIASWISSQFGIKVSKIVNNFITDEYITKIKDAEHALAHKDNKIIKLEQKLDTIISNNNLTLEELKKSNIKNDLTLEELKKSNKENTEIKTILEKNQIKLDKTYNKLVGAYEKIQDIEDKLEDTNYKLDIATDDRVVKLKDISTLEYVIILKTDDLEEKYKYYCIRCQKRSITQRLAEKINYSEIKRIGYTPNSINLYNRIKEDLKDKLDRKCNRFNLKDITEEKFLRKIDKINNQKKNIIY